MQKIYFKLKNLFNKLLKLVKNETDINIILFDL